MSVLSRVRSAATRISSAEVAKWISTPNSRADFWIGAQCLLHHVNHIDLLLLRDRRAGANSMEFPIISRTRQACVRLFKRLLPIRCMFAFQENLSLSQNTSQRIVDLVPCAGCELCHCLEDIGAATESPVPSLGQQITPHRNQCLVQG